MLSPLKLSISAPSIKDNGKPNLAVLPKNRRCLKLRKNLLNKKNRSHPIKPPRLQPPNVEGANQDIKDMGVRSRLFPKSKPFTRFLQIKPIAPVAESLTPLRG